MQGKGRIAAAFAAGNGLFITLDGGRNRQLAQLGGVGKAGGVRHQTGGRRGFREGNHVPDVFSTGQQHAQTVQAKGQAGVRRGTVLQGVQQEAELQALLGRVIPRISNTVACISLLWIRTEPPPTS